MSHKRRMHSLSQWAAPKPGTREYRELQRQMNSLEGMKFSREYLHDMFNKARARVALQLACGSGLALDDQIREYNHTYNSRLFSNSLHDLPASFNVMEAFNRFSPFPLYFQIREERDHKFSFIDFIDYYTNSQSSLSITSIRDATAEGVIYSFNASGDLREFFIRTADGRDFGIVGVSIVRFGSEVSLMMLVGQVCDLNRQSAQLQARAAQSICAPGREHIVGDPERRVEATAIGGEADFWKTIVLVRIDIESMLMDSRSVYFDIGPSYFGFTDEIAAYCGDDGRFLTPEFEELARNASVELAHYSVLFDMCKTFLFLPEYFFGRETEAIVERYVTEYGANKESDDFKGISELTDVASRIAVRNVLSLGRSSTHHADSVSFLSPNIHIEKSGYWKKLPLDSLGEDKLGKPIRGRTWVNKYLSWVEANGEGESLVARRPQLIPNGKNPGYIYVMRSAAHPHDVFKIGLTRRTPEQRAAELTKSTSSPDQFLVIQDWGVADCVLAEALIHSALGGYRFNPQREFFAAPYKLIFNTITKVVEEINRDAISPD